jgi:hypothetical protein
MMLSTGSIPASSVATLLWQFKPLEARHYQVVLPLTLGQQRQQLHISGWGYHPHHPGAKEKACERDASRYAAVSVWYSEVILRYDRQRIPGKCFGSGLPSVSS